MASITINVNSGPVTITPEEVSAKIEAALKLAEFLRMFGNPQINALLDFANKVAHKAFVPKLISLIFDIWNESWPEDIATLKAGLYPIG